jgi:hypothetical protein
VAGATALVAWQGVSSAGLTPLGPVFTYQGELSQGGAPVNGLIDVRFQLFDDDLAGSQIGANETFLNVNAVDGRFTVDVEFLDADAFNGSERWLDVSVRFPAGVGGFVPLDPRQPITAAPYALFALNGASPWLTNGSFVFYNGGNVGIGTNTPVANLEIEKANATLRLSSTATDGTSTLDLQGDAPGGFSANVLGAIRFLDETGAVNAQISSVEGFLGNAFNFAVGGTIEMALTDTGNLGVGTSLPVARLQLANGTDSEPDAGGFLVIGDLNSTNLSFDNNEIMARDNGATATLFLNNDGGDVSILPAGGGQVGIGTPPTGNLLTLGGSLEVIGSTIHVEGDSFSDGVFVEGILGVDTINGGLTYFSREVANGTLIGFRNADDPVVGSISVAGSVVSYNAFTGSHHGWTDSAIEHGALVRLTGENRRGHEGPNCEVTYGIAPTSAANDPACLGAYLSAPGPDDPGASHHLIAAVGNGEVWVVDDGRGNLAPGQYLIASHVPGCAMLDDPARFPVGHIIARVAEPIDWSTIEIGADGSKRALVSILFESFDRHGDAAELNRLANLVAQQRAEIDSLRAKLDSLEAVEERLSRLEIAGAAPVAVQAAALKGGVR